MWNGVAAVLLAVVQAAETAPRPGAAAGGEVLIELIAEDARGQPVKDLKAAEMVVQQDGAGQAIGSFRYLADKAWYELRYVPATGRVGAVAIGVNRRGVQLRGLDGPQVTPRWIAPLQPFEAELQAALDAPQAPEALPLDWAPLRFETRDDTLHHAFVAEIPLAGVSVRPAGSGAQAHLTFLLRVKRPDGRVVHQGSLDQPLDVGPVSAATASVRRFVWSSHVHLRPGQYVAELAVKDVNGGSVGVRRLPLDVAPVASGLRLSSLTCLLGAEGAMAGPEEDNPLRQPEAELVPMLRPRWIAGSGGALSLLAFAYPDAASKEPVSAAIELHRDGQLKTRAAVPLPPPGADGRIRYLGGLKFGGLQPGSYVLKLVAQQGTAHAEESAVLEVSAPPVVKER
jgi:hypothetical protein